MWWNVTIRETLVRVVAVEAEDAYKAEGAVRSQYQAGEIVLEAEDFSGVELEVKEAGEPTPQPLSLIHI